MVGNGKVETDSTLPITQTACRIPKHIPRQNAPVCLRRDGDRGRQLYIIWKPGVNYIKLLQVLFTSVNIVLESTNNSFTCKSFIKLILVVRL